MLTLGLKQAPDLGVRLRRSATVDIRAIKARATTLPAPSRNFVNYYELCQREGVFSDPDAITTSAGHLQSGRGRIPAKSISESAPSAGTRSGSSHTARLGVDALQRLRPHLGKSGLWDARHRGHASQASGAWPGVRVYCQSLSFV